MGDTAGLIAAVQCGQQLAGHTTTAALSVFPASLSTHVIVWLATAQLDCKDGELPLAEQPQALRRGRPGATQPGEKIVLEIVILSGATLDIVLLLSETFGRRSADLVRFH